VGRYKKIKARDSFGREFIYYKKLDDDAKLLTRSKEYDRNGRKSENIHKQAYDGSIREQIRERR
jgi:hypothetical protein